MQGPVKPLGRILFNWRRKQGDHQPHTKLSPRDASSQKASPCERRRNLERRCVGLRLPRSACDAPGDPAPSGRWSLGLPGRNKASETLGQCNVPCRSDATTSNEGLVGFIWNCRMANEIKIITVNLTAIKSNCYNSQ